MCLTLSNQTEYRAETDNLTCDTYISYTSASTSTILRESSVLSFYILGEGCGRPPREGKLLRSWEVWRRIMSEIIKNRIKWYWLWLSLQLEGTLLPRQNSKGPFNERMFFVKNIIFVMRRSVVCWARPSQVVSLDGRSYYVITIHTNNQYNWCPATHHHHYPAFHTSNTILTGPETFQEIKQFIWALPKPGVFYIN